MVLNQDELGEPITKTLRATLAAPKIFGRGVCLPVAVVLHDAGPVCPDAAGQERWPCPTAVNRRDVNLAPVLQGLAAQGAGGDHMSPTADA
ncbi:MAG TPA: hypothetical protein PKD53_07130, partial [Chloroflexaceae bacterium]|nr:hypothetical protein [Chloroflexaceae bacterium]